ncbi:alpha/beta-hydrolase [Gloeophyllum trabeum ATCC 11539]|uniref:sn-1-specific diacylglycerol lipase n=1 Tax=Gloeophyllum trabeum (strain ATCC 11539 / FP-39264 / Madison 617) TaxID=670483 RepID=S7S1S6_GLOTA|nr:alpha/beta-hydrolase [Gloeophyllum trabeum ATCC 11539]EPQ59724.1 alpha/beta-hydrolase [Gloeophyllum trabeum ATCC 11539]
MASNWDRYSRFGIDAASSAAALGFSAAKFGTKLGFSITRGVASTAANITGSVVDYALFGGATGAGKTLSGAVSSVITLIEQIALAPIVLGETITSTSVIAAHSSINVLSAIFPGSDEASFSLASFVELVRREWNDPVLRECLPERRYGVTEIAKALVAWGALQGVTEEWQEKRWFKYLREIDPDEDAPYERTRRDSRVHVTKDVIYPGHRGQIITADIVDVGPSPSPSSLPSTPSRHLQVPRLPPLNPAAPRRPSNAELKATLRRLSKLVLAGYGGASLLFFGVSLDPPDPASSTNTSSTGFTSAAQKASEEAKLARAVDASEQEASSAPQDDPASPKSPSTTSSYAWWDVLLGRHDHEIFTRFADHLASEQGEKERERKEAQVQREMVEERKRKISAVIGNERLMPRFWILRDHGRRQVVLVLRGTMSLNELAVDLTCDPEEFEPASSARDGDIDEESDIPGAFPVDAQMQMQMHPLLAQHRRQRTASTTSTLGGPRKYQVHGGMLRMARVMGGKGKPVHVAVKDALKRNPGYELVLSGHSLGAGVAALLGMLWADPRTCLTVPSSGLPVGRRVSVYCFAPPCVADGPLSALCASLITSFVYSNDVVARLSLGSVRDITRAAAWLCDSRDDGYASVTKRALKRKTGFGAEEDHEWFLSIRKTLEANMHMANMYPPGRVWWAVRDADLHPRNRRYTNKDRNRARLFEVLDAEKVFDQIIFARDMLSSHLPHQYDRVLHDLS